MKREIDSRNVFSRETRRTTDAAFSVSASRSQQRGLEEEGFVILTLPNGRRELTTFLDSQTFKLLCSLYRVAARADKCVNCVPSAVTADSGFGTPRNDDWVYDTQLSMVL